MKSRPAHFPAMFFRALRPALLACLLLGGADPAAAWREPSVRLYVNGRTVMCAMEPCLWRGISRAVERDGKRAYQLVWSRPELPEIHAEPAVRSAIETAWREQGCKVVQGWLEDGVLRVHGLLGDCHPGPLPPGG